MNEERLFAHINKFKQKSRENLPYETFSLLKVDETSDYLGFVCLIPIVSHIREFIKNLFTN